MNSLIYVVSISIFIFTELILLIRLHEHLHMYKAKRLGYKNIKMQFFQISFIIPQNFISYNDVYKICYFPYPFLFLIVFILSIIYQILFNSYSNFILLIIFGLPFGNDLNMILWKYKYFTNHKKYLELSNK